MAGQDRWWDWTGAGWMAGENPLLLIDSALPDVVGDNPRTCWLVLDAHRSIPFQLIESSGQYEAPPRFRARITHNGQSWNAEQRTWGTVPTEFSVYLYDGELKYTFVAIYEDVPGNRWDSEYVIGAEAGSHNDPDVWAHASYHDRPYTPNQFHRADPGNRFASSHDPYAAARNPGFGIPYYGVCVRIEDRYGHIAQMDYCESVGRPLDDPASPTCVECQQGCLAKGQLRSIKLKTRNTSGGYDTNWTLLYSHRMFVGLRYLHLDDSPESMDFIARDYPDSPANAAAWELHGSIAIDRIFVFQGEPTNVSAGGCMTISHHDAPRLDDGADPLAIHNALNPNEQITAPWEYMVRYHYASDATTGECTPIPHLLKTTVRRRAEGVTDGVGHSTTVYHYRSFRGEVYPPLSDSPSTPWLEAIFTDSDLARLSNAIAAGTVDLPGSLDANAVALWLNTGQQPPQTLGDGPGSLGEVVKGFASVVMHPPASVVWPPAENSEVPSKAALLGGSPPNGGYLRPAIGADALESDRHEASVAALVVSQGTGKRYYRIHRLVVRPDSSATPNSPTFPTSYGGWQRDSMRSVYVHPYLWQSFMPWEGNRAYTEPVDLSLPRWIAIVDEFADLDTWNDGTYGSDGRRDGLINRRVVEMNPAGHILRDRTWEYRGDQTVVSGGGLGEQHRYVTVEEYFEGSDWELAAALEEPEGEEGAPPRLPVADAIASLRRELLLVQHRSVGWSADEDTATETSSGMLRHFKYEFVGDTALPPAQRLTLVAESIQHGNRSGSPDSIYTRQSFFDPSLYGTQSVDCQVEYLTPETALLGAAPPLAPAGPAQVFDHKVTYTITERDPNQEVEHPSERRVTGRMIVGPPRRVNPDSDWYYPVEREFYDENGNPTWAATGQLKNPWQPGAGAHDSLVFTHYIRDGYRGLTRHTILDASPGQITAPDGDWIEIPVWPQAGTVEWSRIGATGALNYVTSFHHDSRIGLTDTYFPNGRRWARRVFIIPDPDFVQPEPSIDPPKIAREFILNDLVSAGAGFPGLHEAKSPCEIKDHVYNQHAGLRLGSPRLTRRVVFQGPIDVESGALAAAVTPTHFEVLWGIRVAPDANGRIARADLLEPDPSGALLQVGTRETNDLGEVLREREIDGTITRTTRSPIGRNLRRYVGVSDTGFGHMPDENFDMVMLDRVEYGLGTHDAWLPTVSRTYMSHPSWDNNDPFGTPPSADTEGIATVTTYDWRMRPVRVDSYAKGDPADPQTARLATSLTFLDHLDRPVLAVSFGAGAPAPEQMPAGLEPSLLEVWDGSIRPIDFYSPSLPRPTAIATMSYGPDGTLTERRTYDVAWQPPTGGGGEPGHHAEFTYTGQGGAEVFAQRPGQPVTVKILDGVGRVVSTKSVLTRAGFNPWTYEVSRTDYVYDVDGNVIETTRWERALEDAAGVLTTANAVRSRSLSWYDVKKRLIASADLGTEDATDTFVTGAGMQSRPADPPQSTTDPAAHGLPPYAQVWLYEYDRAGNQVRTADPGGSETVFEFSSMGRLTAKIENAADPDPALRRKTEYEYQYGRLVKMCTDRAPLDQTTKPQQTKVVYGADIVDESFDTVSRNNGLVGRMFLPNESGAYPTGAVDGTLWITLKYNFAGQVAERIDARGVVQRYRYDDQGRLASVQVGRYDVQRDPGGQPATITFAPYYPDSLKPPGAGVPVDRIGHVAYTYDTRGNLFEITARTVPSNPAVPAGGQIITQNRYQRDFRGNLLMDWQSHGKSVETLSTPRVDYLWEFEPTGAGTAPSQFGHNRLTRITYPAQPGFTVQRQLFLDYSHTGTTDYALSRIVGITSNIMPYNLAEFTHVGVGRRAGTALAGGQIAQNFAPPIGTQDPPVGLPGLDRFGRIKDLHYQNSASTPVTLFRAQYAFDSAGNRVSARLTQASVGTQSRDNTHSQVNRYDGLHRLLGTDVGELIVDPEDGLPKIAPQTLVRSDAWELDLLGNWVGKQVSGSSGQPGGAGAPPIPSGITSKAGRLSWGQLDVGIPGVTPTSGREFRALTHLTNEQNELRAIDLEEGDADDPPSPPNPQRDFVRRDASGNLIADAEYYYQYDAWGRIIQINRVVWTLAQPPPTPSPGEPVPLPGELASIASPGLLVKHYTYDGLGRLVRTQSPYPTVEQGAQTKQTRGEHFYYDGIRRIQEVVTDPVETIEMLLASGDPELEALAAAEAEQSGEDELDLKAVSLKLEAEQGEVASGGGGSAAAGGGGGGGGGTPAPLPEFVTYVSREYVWGPGDASSGVDELLVQFDNNRWAWWVLQDAGGDVVAVCDMNGPGQKARVVGQWRYDAYGAATAAEHLASFPQIHCGHKALFFDRLDVGVGDDAAGGSSGGEPPRLIPYAHLLVHMRNRAYSPQTGRFMQPDPNATALTLIEATAYHGRGLDALVAAFEMQGLYGDGMNLYEYAGSNPWMRADPLGLSWDPFDMVDEFQAEHAGSVAAFMSALGQGAKAAAVVAAQIASYLPFPIVGNLGDIALYALGEQSETELAVALGMGLIPGGKLAAKFGGLMNGLGSFLGRIGSSAWSGAKHYAGKYSGALSRGASGLMARARKFLKGCGCFEAQTEIWTARGLVPIEEIEEGDLVIATDESTGVHSLRRVKETFSRLGAPIVALTLLIGGAQAETLKTTEEHPFYVSGRGWVPAQNLKPGEVVQTLTTGTGRSANDGSAGQVAEVALVEFTSRRATVYNFEVEGVHTYRVGANGVLVHNRGPCKLVKHHWIPQQKDLEAWARRAGLEVDDFVKLIPEDMHRWMHGNHRRPQDFNFRWQEFRKSNPQARKEEILAFRDQMVAHYQSEWAKRTTTP